MSRQPPDLAKAADLQDLVRLMRTQAHVLQQVLNNADSYYRPLDVPKSRRGEIRRTWEVDRPLRDMQRQVRDWLSIAGKKTKVATAFWKGSSHAINASRHLGARYVTIVDLHNFFGTVTSSMVHKVMVNLGCREPIAHVLTSLCVKDNMLPQGTRSSPILSNLVCNELDVEIESFAMARGMAVTRYVDDLALSGETSVTLDELAALVGRHGFTCRPGSYRVFRKGGPQFVTGICVADHESGVVRLPRRYKQWLRVMVHYTAIHGVHAQAEYLGWDVADLCLRLSGHLWYSYGVEPRFAEPLMDDALGCVQAYLETLSDADEDGEDNSDSNYYG